MLLLTGENIINEELFTATSELFNDLLPIIINIIRYTGLLIAGFSIMSFIRSFLEENIEGKAPSIARIGLGMAITGLSFISEILISSDEGLASQKVTETVENISEAIIETEKTASILPDILSILFAAVIAIAISILLLVAIYHLTKDKIVVEDSSVYKNIDDISSEVKACPDESVSISLKNMQELNNLWQHSTGEIKEKLQYIYTTIKTLEENKVDTGNLHDYYIPELINVFQHSEKIMKIASSGPILKRQHNDAKELQIKAIDIVTNVVNELLTDYTESQLIKAQCDTEVMETMLSMNGYQ